MLKNIKNDLFHSLNILESLGKIKVYSKEAKTAEEFFYLNEQLNFNASLNLLANIGETTSKLSAKLRGKYPQVEWKEMKNFRNRIAHD